MLKRLFSIFYKLLEINEHCAVLYVVEGLVSVLPDEVLAGFLKDHKISNFLAETLGRNDFLSIKICVSIVERVLLRIPEEIVNVFIKEGVFNRMKTFKLVGEVSKLDRPVARSNTFHDFNSFSAFNYRKIDKSLENTKLHTENVRKVVKTVKETMIKVKKYEKIAEQEASSIKEISKSLISSTSGSENTLKMFFNLIKPENNISSYEFTTESLGSSLWNYVSQLSFQQLMPILLSSNSNSTNFENLTKILIESIQFLQNFNFSLAANKKLMQTIKFEYFSSENNKNPVFSNFPNFTLSVPLSTLIENLKISLFSVNSEQDLKFLIESYKLGRNIGLSDYFQDIIDDNCRKSINPSNLKIQFFINNSEIDD